MEFEIPLIVPMATKYFDKAKDNNKDLYYRVLDIRLCLEKIADSMIFEFVTDKTQEEWHNYSLHKKLMVSKEFGVFVVKEQKFPLHHLKFTNHFIIKTRSRI